MLSLLLCVCSVLIPVDLPDPGVEPVSLSSPALAGGFFTASSAFNVVPEDSEAVFTSFRSFFFTLLHRSYFHHSACQLTYPFFCLSYSAVDSF